MSKIKNASSSSANTALNNLDISQAVSSAANAELFNSLFQQMSVEQEASYDQKNSNKDQQKSQEQNDKKVEDVSAPSKVQSGQAAKNEETEKVRHADDDRELTEAEKAELEQIEAEKISVEQLSQQLGVLLESVRQNAQQLQQKGSNPFQDIKVISAGTVKASDLSSAIQEIPQEVLRKVDVKTLDEQLGRIMKGNEVLDVDVPQDDIEQQIGIQAVQLERVNVEQEEFRVDLIQTGTLVVKKEKDIRELAKEASEIIPLMAQQQDIRQEVKEDVSLKVETERRTVSTGLEEFNKALKTEEFKIDMTSNKQYVFRAGEAIETGPEKLDFVIEHFDLTETVNSTPKTAQHAEKHPVLFHTATPQPQQTEVPLNEAVANKVREKVEQVIFNMAKTGKPNVTRIQLHPEQLGKIDIQLEIKDKLVKASVVTDSAETRDAILKHLPQIKEILASDNMMLDQFSAQHDHRHFDHSTPKYFDQQSGAPQNQQQQRWRDETYGTGSGNSFLGTAENRKVVNAEKDSLLNITV